MDNSILWKNETEKMDNGLVSFLVNKTVTGFDFHKKSCVDKIVKTIKTTRWQDKFTNRGFVFALLYSFDAKIIEIKFSLMCQALDSLYFQISKNNKTDNFGDKIKYVFKYVYGRKMRKKTSNALRIIRDDVMHTGEIMGIAASRKSLKDSNTLKSYFEEINRPKQQKTSDVQDIISLASSFNYLMEEIVLRILGLGDDSFEFNLNPPSHLNYFEKK